MSVFSTFENFLGKPNMHKISLGHPYFVFFVERKVIFQEINKIQQSKRLVKGQRNPLMPITNPRGRKNVEMIRITEKVDINCSCLERK